MMKNSIEYIQLIKFNHVVWFWIILIPSDYLIGQTADSTVNIVNNQIWLDFYPHVYINEKLEYYGDFGYRTVLDDYSWHWIYTRPSVRYHISDLWEGHGGVGLFYEFNKFSVNRFEVRPWQGLKINWPRFERLKFYHYLRLEERISFLTNDWKASFDFRLRYKLAGTLIILKSGRDSFWFIPFYGEVFVSVFDEVEEVFRNRSRAGIGLGYNHSKEWRFVFIYNRQTSRSGPDEDLTISDNIFRLEVGRLWNFKTLIKF